MKVISKQELTELSGMQFERHGIFELLNDIASKGNFIQLNYH